MHPRLFVLLYGEPPRVCPTCQGYGEILVETLDLEFVEIENIHTCPDCLGAGIIENADLFDVELELTS